MLLSSKQINPTEVPPPRCAPYYLLPLFQDPTSNHTATSFTDFEWATFGKFIILSSGFVLADQK
jgi:hypothetical protein